MIQAAVKQAGETNPLSVHGESGLAAEKSVDDIMNQYMKQSQMQKL